jgi:hypothetical protein
MTRNLCSNENPFIKKITLLTAMLSAIGLLGAGCGNDNNQAAQFSTQAGSGATTSSVGTAGTVGTNTTTQGLGTGGTITATGAGGSQIKPLAGAGGATTGIAGASGKSTVGTAGGAAVSTTGTAGKAGKAGAAVGTAGAAGGAAGTSGNKIIPDRCNGDVSKVALIGDSYFGMTTVHQQIEQLSGQTYSRRSYASGTMMSTDNILGPSIPNQARAQYAQGPVQTFLMDGGGNDALENTNCTAIGLANPSCQSDVDNALAVCDDFLDEAEQNGVQEIIWFYYPHIITSAAINNAIDDYAIPIVTEKCQSRKRLSCTLIDTRADFPPGDSSYFIIDGIHPSDKGSKVIANLMWEAMQKNCKDGISVTK